MGGACILHQLTLLSLDLTQDQVTFCLRLTEHQAIKVKLQKREKTFFPAFLLSVIVIERQEKQGKDRDDSKGPTLDLNPGHWGRGLSQPWYMIHAPAGVWLGCPYENIFHIRCQAAWCTIAFVYSKRHFGDIKYPLDCRGSENLLKNVSYSNANSTLCPPQAIIQQRKVISCSKDKNSCRDKLLK